MQYIYRNYMKLTNLAFYFLFEKLFSLFWFYFFFFKFWQSDKKAKILFDEGAKRNIPIFFYYSFFSKEYVYSICSFTVM